MKQLVTIGALAAVLLAAGTACAQEDHHHDHQHPKRSGPWDPEVVRLFQTLPVQDGGRVKPLDTLAGFKLLKFRGVRSCPTKTETLTPIQWLLDVLFYPEAANEYEIFLIQDSAVLDAIGLRHDAKKKRDRYSFEELAPGIEKLFEEARKYLAIEDKDRSPLQEQTVQLAHSLNEYESLTRFLDFARAELPLRGSPQLEQVFGPQDRGLAVFVAKMPQLNKAYEASDEKGKEALGALLQSMQAVTEPARALILFPSSDKAEPRWMSPSHLPVLRSKGVVNLDRQIACLGLWEQLERTKADPVAFKATLQQLHKDVGVLADERGEYKKIPLEVAFYKADFFYKALVLFGLSFILVALSWLWETPWLTKGSLALLGLATALLVAGITMRCIIRSRPPVSTLYETILFISAVAVVVAMGIEWINRQRIAIAVAPIMGALGMFLAYKYEFKEASTAGDTMGSLVAVLDTNFWLSTHVTSVTMGYSAGLLAAAIAHVWLLGKIFGWKKNDDKFYKTVARMTYGVLCFGLLFSTVGTILGGIWANYSWGRFWGWDPKENGALMICLWELIILHARMGGYIRDYGLCVLATLGGLVIAFSWWGVNLLGVGLHSYGFTSGILQILVGFNVLELLIVLVSVGWWLGQRANGIAAGVTPKTEPVEA